MWRVYLFGCSKHDGTGMAKRRVWMGVGDGGVGEGSNKSVVNKILDN